MDVSDIFHQNAFAEMNKEESKLRTYKLFKTSAGVEPYLTEIKNVKHRIAFSKFRLSNHTLMIEKARHIVPPIKKEFRFCPFCHNSVEDEIHFLTKCEMYSLHREILFNEIGKNDTTLMRIGLDDQAKFVFLMSNIKSTPLVAKHLTKTRDLREFLLRKHKCNA